MFTCFETLLRRGTEEHLGIDGSVDIINSTLGKALGGAAGGYTAGPKQLIDLLRNRSRPYLFSNTLPPPVVACANKVKKHVFDGNGLFTHCRIRTRIKTGIRTSNPMATLHYVEVFTLHGVGFRFQS